MAACLGIRATGQTRTVNVSLEPLSISATYARASKSQKDTTVFTNKSSQLAHVSVFYYQVYLYPSGSTQQQLAARQVQRGRTVSVGADRGHRWSSNKADRSLDAKDKPAACLGVRARGQTS
jgi:hypothetical protein